MAQTISSGCGEPRALGVISSHVDVGLSVLLQLMFPDIHIPSLCFVFLLRPFSSCIISSVCTTKAQEMIVINVFVYVVGQEDVCVAPAREKPEQ